MRVRRYPDKHADGLLADKTTLSIRTFVTGQIMSFCVSAKFDKRQKGQGKGNLFKVGSSFSYETDTVSMAADGAPFCPPSSLSARFYGCLKLWLHGSEETRSRR